MRGNDLPRLLIIATKIKMRDVTAPYPSIAKATDLLFTNIFILISYSPVRMSNVRPNERTVDSRFIGVHRAVEKK